jgi:phosphoglycerate dehydrogenase-like enzyme
MFNILVNSEYEWLFETLKAEAPEFFSLKLADFSCPDENQYEQLSGTDAIIGQKINLSNAQYEAAGKLQIIQTLSAGFDHIDLAKAKQRKVYVANNNGANAESVAEHVLMLILALYRQLLFHHNSVTQGTWTCLKFQNRGLSGKTLGIFGLGNTGKALARRASTFGVKIKYFDIVRQADAEKDLGLKFVFPEELLKHSDILSYHVPKTSYTRCLINRNSLNKMKAGALLINTSRGDVHDENAIYEALISGKISGAGLDVFEKEPLPKKSPLCKLDNVLLTPHSAPDKECYTRTISNAFDNLTRVSKGEKPQALAVDHEEATRQFLKRFPEINFYVP